MNGAPVPTSELARPPQPPSASPGVSSAIRLVAQNLAICAQHKTCNVDSFSQLCVTLSRGMDYAISNKLVPADVSELPVIFKLVCQRRNEFSLQAAIMVLMVTVKNACKAQWFSSQESQELLTLADEMGRMFCTPEGISCEQADIIPTVSQIMSRYYPQFKLGCILASVAIKPGFEACALDFHILKTVNRSATERIHLLVAIKDNIDTSSCIINPPKVNILLNGVGLPGRIVGCMQGPQLPSVVNHMLRYGTNLLQAIGHFDAHCIVLIAYMSSIRPCDLPTPRDYQEAPATTVDSEAEIIEGPSKISLNCPISFTRIRRPVKGHLCKHLQCFDLSNYIEINFKRPSWRCPHCNQPVCYPDIRIDQKMFKILQEVAENATNVTIHSDGSWEAFSGSDNDNGESHANVSQELHPDQQEASGMLTPPSNIYDLTDGNDDIISLDFDAPEDRKVVVQPEANGVVPLENSHGQGDYTRMSSPEANIVVPAAPAFLHLTPHLTTSPVLTYSAPPAVNREQQAFLGTNPQSSIPTLVHPPLNNNLWSQQQLQHGQINGAYAMPGNVNRTPVAAQALPPVQIPSSSPTMMSSRAPFMNSAQNHSSLPLNTSLPHSVAYSTSAGTVQVGSIQHQRILQSQMQQVSNAQMRGFMASVHVPNNATRATRPGLEARPQQHPMYQMPPQMVCRPPHLRAAPQIVNQTGYPHNHMASSPAQPMTPSQTRAPRTLSATENINVLAARGLSSVSGGSVQRVSRTEDLMGAQQPGEQNWQPTGRMRGSLAGRAYNEARDQLMIRPTQQTRPSAPTSRQYSTLSPQLQVLLANRNLHSVQPNLSQNN